MPTTTKTPSRTRTQSRIELDSVELEISGLESGERSAGEERSEPGGRATRGAGGTLRAAAGGPPVGHRRELSQELIDEAVDRARLRALVELPDGGRISDEVIDQLLAGASVVSHK
jgi:hypothetical protein